jgi:hypothetical protein
MKKAPTKSQYSLAEASSRAEKFAALANLDKRDLLADIEQCTVNADTEQEHQAKTAIARAQCLLLALARKWGVSCDGLTTIAAQWATMNIDRIKMEREAQV